MQLSSRRSSQDLVLVAQADHGLVPVSEVTVPQQRIISQRPLSSGVLITPVIPFPGKIHPFRMTKFIAHEVEIPFPTERKGDHPDQFVQSDAPVDDQVLL